MLKGSKSIGPWSQTSAPHSWALTGFPPSSLKRQLEEQAQLFPSPVTLPHPVDINNPIHVFVISRLLTAPFPYTSYQTEMKNLPPFFFIPEVLLNNSVLKYHELGGVKQQECIPSPFWSWKSGIRVSAWPCSLCGLPGLFWASGAGNWSLAVPGLRLYCCNLSLCTLSSYEDTDLKRTPLSTHPTPLWPYFNWLHPQRPISK